MQEFEKIKKIRTTLKLTQQEMADAIGVSKQYFSKVENDHTELSKEKYRCFQKNLEFRWIGYYMIFGRCFTKMQKFNIRR